MLSYRFNSLPNLFCITFDEIFEQDGNVVPAFAERGYLNRKNIQPVEKILSECSGSNGTIQVAVRRRQHADIYGYRLATANAFEFPFLEHSQQSYLSLGWKFPDLIQENGPAVRQFKAPQTSLCRSGEGAFLVPKQFRGNQRCRDRCAIYTDKRPR